MPLVMWPMGTSSAFLSGKSECHISRLTWPCNSLTPLAARDIFRAKTVMQNDSFLSFGWTRPRAISSSSETLSCA